MGLGELFRVFLRLAVFSYFFPLSGSYDNDGKWGFRGFFFLMFTDGGLVWFFPVFSLNFVSPFPG